jgi:putative lipoic acid-binding regulatory protein
LEQKELEFPCQFPLKVIGTQSVEFRTVVIDIIRRHVVDLDEARITTRPSTGGKYIALTATFQATSREQLDALYRELGASENVIILL